MGFPTRRLGGSDCMATVLGFGGAPLGNLYAPIPEAVAADLLAGTWDAGLRLYDTAPFYGFGLSERRIGDFLREKPRADFVVSTKVGRMLVPDPGDHPARQAFKSALPFRPVFDYSYDAVMRSFEDSLQRLGLDRIDVLLMHDIGRVTHGDRHEELFRIAMDGGARALTELRDQGVVKAIGLGVNEWEVCEAAMDHARWDTFLLAGRYTLLEQESLASFLPRCEREGVTLIVGGPFNSGILATGPVAGARYNYEPAPPEILERARAIEAVCRDHGVPLAAAALAFPLTHPAIASVIPGMANRAELDANLALMRATIPAALWTDLKAAGLIRPDAPIPAADQTAATA
ncbi:aldo/keto reductase [Chthonobacter rhizosphaerae]|uniref:aldo/keto reductase n=1 Tax=Chthonobacter rhizosphaerae TaxID=2735553 RepID=UPI0015EF8422|nr:aldo/keto reductase [Chthonobacter rhizosphaerae]